MIGSGVLKGTVCVWPLPFSFSFSLCLFVCLSVSLCLFRFLSVLLSCCFSLSLSLSLSLSHSCSLSLVYNGVSHYLHHLFPVRMFCLTQKQWTQKKKTWILQKGS
ncbi:mCG144912 [Mus musculus]|nr:mCG144912 [Mus musculus]